MEIHHFRGELPCDLISIQQVRDKCSGICLRGMTKTFNPGLKDDINRHPHPHPHDDIVPDLANGHHYPHHHPHPMAQKPYMDGMDRWCDHPHPLPDNEMSFKTQGRVIYTSFPEGVVELAYRAIPVDEDGYPLLVDDETYLAALEAYIKVRVFTVKFDTGKLAAPILQNAQTEYAWLSAQLMDTMTVPSVSEMESIQRAIMTMLPNMRTFDKGFKDFGDREYLRRHNGGR